MPCSSYPNKLCISILCASSHTTNLYVVIRDNASLAQWNPAHGPSVRMGYVNIISIRRFNLLSRLSFLRQQDRRRSNEISYWLSQTALYVILKASGFLTIFRRRREREGERKSAYVYAFLGFNYYLISSVLIVLGLWTVHKLYSGSGCRVIGLFGLWLDYKSRVIVVFGLRVPDCSVAMESTMVIKVWSLSFSFLSFGFLMSFDRKVVIFTANFSASLFLS